MKRGEYNTRTKVILTNKPEMRRIVAVTGKARVQEKTLIESRKSEGWEGGVTDALLRRVTTLDQSRTD